METTGSEMTSNICTAVGTDTLNQCESSIVHICATLLPAKMTLIHHLGEHHLDLYELLSIHFGLNLEML